MKAVLDLILEELRTPSGQTGPLSDAYVRAVTAGGHALLGAAVCAYAGAWGLAFAIPVGLSYWVLKERSDLRRGGAVLDGAEDAVMVSIGAWYGVTWWPAVVLACMGYILASAAWRRA